MFIENHIPNRQKGEKLVLFLRRHWLIFLGYLVFYIFLAAIPFGIYYFLKINYSEYLTDQIIYPFLLLLASLYYLYILLFLYHAFLDYNLDVWIVTNKRIINIEQKGLFNREVAKHELSKIQDVTGMQKGVLQSIFKFGDVHIQTAGEIQRFVFYQIPNPFKVVKIINHLLEEIDEKRHGNISAQKNNSL